MLTENLLRKMWPNGNSRVPGLIEAIIADAPRVFHKHGINSDLVLAHAMAQFTHECGGGRNMVESIEYTPQRACEVWPSRFSDPDDCLRKVGSFAGDPDFKFKLINSVYGGRNGNTEPNDGVKYIGRGLAQVTGKGNYKKLGDKVGLDLVGDPSLVIKAENALECGVAEFVVNGCVPFAEADDVIEVSLHLNGGFVGFAERTTLLKRWKKELGVPEVLGRGMYWVQEALNALGASPPLVVDGEYGENSKRALKKFQVQHGLKQTGTPNRDTMAAIREALPQA